jgi:LCP family protein required for cell wall assembly
VVTKSVIAYGQVVDTTNTQKAPILRYLGEINPNQLQGEGDGRVNVLLIGIGGTKHPGGNLADTIMVASFDPKNKEVALLSIPRDLYVPIDGTKSWSKINAVHSYGEESPKKYGSGPALLKKTVGTILDLPIHYYVRVDFEALKKIVDTLNGVTVDVERPIVDLSYPADNMVDFSPFRLAAGVQTLDGPAALKYARSRHAGGGEGSDFSRARRQQKLLTAIREKALTAGVLGNPKKVADIITILGSHVKTDLSLKEMERFIQLWKDIDSSKVISKVLDNGPTGPLVAHSGDSRGYILLPRTGDYGEVQEIAHEIFTDPYLRQEKATLAFVNATGNVTTGKQIITLLKRYGYQVTDVTTKTQTKESETTLIDHTSSKPYTKKFLESRYSVKATTHKSEAEFYDMTLTVGTDYAPAKTKGITVPTVASPASSPKVTPNATPSSE